MAILQTLRSMTGGLLLLMVWLPAMGHAAGPAPRLEDDIRSHTLDQADRRAAALARDHALVDVARAHSEAMYETDTLAHQLAGAGPADRLARHHRALFGLVSENVAVQKRWPQGTDLAELLVRGWMNSPPHRANILAGYDRFEVGCYGERNIMYCTQMFVRSATSLAEEVAFRQPANGILDVKIAGEAPPGVVERRIGIAPLDAAPSDRGVLVADGLARAPVPTRPGRYQLKLLTRQSDDPSRYRVVGGPYVCVTAPGQSPARGGCGGPG